MSENNEIIIKEGEKFINYPSISQNCNSLGSTIPIGFAREQVFFNNDIKTILFDIDEYVMQKLKYTSKDEMCKGFAKEQIDAIATAIFNWERNGNALIVSDQTGLGKGRIVAGLIRYSILTLGKTPIFFTEKKNLFSDIYRDLYDIGLDAGVAIEVKTSTITVTQDQLTDKFILKVIKRDIKDNEELKVDFSMPNDDQLSKLVDGTYEDELDEVIELYREYILQNGIEEGTGTKKVDSAIYKKNLENAQKEGRILVTPYAPFALDIKDKTGNIIYSISQGEAKKPISEGELPNKYRLILMLYTTLQRGIFSNDVLTEKGRFIQNVSEDNVMLLDESHNAAGESLRSRVMVSMLRSAKYACYVSATWAKKPTNLPIYSVRTSIKDSYLSFPQIVMAFNSGGNALQEAVSSKLVSSGQLVSRQRPFEGEVFYYKEDDSSAVGKQQVDKLNRVTMMWDAILELSSSCNEELRNEVKKIFPSNDESDNEYRKQFKYKGRTNRLAFNLFNYFLLGLKVNQCVQEALNQLRDGKKVVISIGNTLESAFTNLKSDYANDVSYEIGDRIRNDFSLMLEYLAHYCLKVGVQSTRVTDSGEEEKELVVENLSKNDFSSAFSGMSVGGLGVNEVFSAIRPILLYNLNATKNRIFTVGLPLSPIDYIKAIIKNEGFSIDEITGRTTELVFVEENGAIDFEYGILSKREKTDKSDLVNDFNSNKLDCVIINQTGATGLSLHALPTIVQSKIVPPVNVVTPTIPVSLQPTNEVKQRCMLILQMELNIATEVQKLGRINRNGQVFPPIYKYIISAIPSEARLAAMMQKKLKSLMSNTKGEQDAGQDIFDQDDLFSDTAVIPWNDTCEKLNLQLSLFGVSNGKEIENKTKMFYFASYDMQVNFFTTLKEKLQEHISDLKSKGQYFAQIKYQDYEAKTEGVIPFIIGDNNATSEFANHTYAELAECTVYDQKNTEISINTSIVDKLYAYSLDNYEEKTFSNYDEWLSLVEKQSEKISNDYIDVRNRSIAELKEQIVFSNDVLSRAQSEANKIPKVEEVISLEEQVKSLSKEKSELQSLALKNLDEGIEDKTISPRLQQITKQYNLTTETLRKSLGDLFATSEDIKSKLRDLERTIKFQNGEIESNERRIESLNKEIREQGDIRDRYMNFCKSIGGVFKYKNYERVLLPTEENAFEITNEEYAHNLNISEDVVLTGCKFNFNSNIYFTKSSIELSLEGATNKYSVTLSKLFPSFSEQDLEMGFQPLDVLEPLEQDYKGYWDEYIKNLNTGYKKQKVFLSGNLLRGIAFNHLIQYSGNITKYSTADRKLQISLELSDDSAKSVMPKFNDGVNYSLLFGMTEENINRIMPQMIANAAWYDQKTISTQLMYDGSDLFLLATISDSLYRVLENEKNSYFEREEFVSGVKKTISENFKTEVVFTISSNKYEPILAFDGMLNGLGSESSTDLENVFDDEMAHFLFEVQYQEQTSGRGRKKQVVSIPWASPINTFDSHPLKSFVKYNTNLNITDYIISQTLLENINASNSGTQWFTPKFNLSLSISSFIRVVEYLKSNYTQLVAVTSANSLDLAEPKYVFDIASSTKGILDNTGVVEIDGIASAMIPQIEDCINAFIEFYKSFKI